MIYSNFWRQRHNGNNAGQQTHVKMYIYMLHIMLMHSNVFGGWTTHPKNMNVTWAFNQMVVVESSPKLGVGLILSFVDGH